MGLFKRNRPEQPPERPPGTGQVAFAQQARTQAMQWQAQARQLQAQAMQQAAAFQQASAGSTAAAGSPTWVRQVLAILAPPQALEAEMKQHVMGLRYGGNMMSPTVEPDSFWPVADTLDKQIANSQALYRSAGLADLDPDRAGHLTGKFAWSGFCQGWLGMLPADAGERLLDRAGLKNEYVPIQAEDGQPRHCGGCGGEFTALPGTKAVICDGCGRTMDLGSAEIPCASCGATMTLPAGADGVDCPFCQSRVERAGIR
jgi:LSD1 subclass zinc finger protein